MYQTWVREFVEQASDLIFEANYRARRSQEQQRQQRKNSD
jgi:hypothetical protein